MRSNTCSFIMRPEGGRIIRRSLLPLITASIVISGTQSTYAYTAVKGNVTCNSGIVRKEASTGASFAFGVRKDEEVLVVDEKKGDDGKLWYEVKVGGSTGYIRSDLVKKSETGADGKKTAEEKKQDNDNKEATGSVLVDVAIMRQSASTKAPLERCLKQNDEVKLLSSVTGDDNKTWYQVSYEKDGIKFNGYVRSDLLKASGAPGNVSQGGGGAVQASSTGAASGVQIGTVKGAGVNVRETAVDGKVVGMVSTGRAVTVTEQVTGSDGNIWYKISFISNLTPHTGYIRSDFVEGVTANVTAEATEQGTSSLVEEEKKPEAKQTDEPANEPANEVNRPGAVNGINVNIRKAPVDGEILTWLSTGSTVYVLKEIKSSDDRIWYEISYKIGQTEQKGYMRADYISLEENKSDYTEAEAMTGTVRGYGVRIRESAVNGTVVDQLNLGHRLDIKGELSGSDDNKWYYVEFSSRGDDKKGYIRSDYVNVITTAQNAQPTSDVDFENSIGALPESYKANLRALHESHPYWQFEVVETGLDWNEAVSAECSVGKNLVPLNSISSWKSTEPQAYNWSGNWWYGFDGGTWASASREIISYYMDPRNFLDESGIYQFEKLDSLDYQGEEGVAKIASGTFLDSSFTDTDGVERNYVSVITEAAKAMGISPYHLATRIIQEQGIYGRSQSISGTLSGHEGYFNYFNIGAYAANGRLPVENGLIYAAGNDEDYFRPWNSRYRSIYGSAKYVAEKYIKKGQNTLYFEKFNVVNGDNGIYSHQYMSNIQAASSESARMKKAYADNDSALVFRIPYYYNMPDTPCIKPTGESNPNNYLSGLSVEGYGIAPEFNPSIDTYYLTVDNSVTYIDIGATAVASTSSIGGVGTIELTEGTNTIPVVCKAQNGNTRTYTLYVQRY